jgi:ubiquitin fusion degradation protein 1
MELRLAIEAWIASHKLHELELRLISDFLLEFSFGVVGTFQIGTDDKWRPMFLTFLEHSDLLTPINNWIEQQGARPDFCVIDLLDHLDQLRRSAVAATPQQTASGKSDQEASKFAAALEKMMQARPGPEKKMKADGAADDADQGDGIAPAAVAAAAPPPPPPVRVQATAAHFDAEIIPALREYLEGENFHAYEVEEWVRRVQMVVARDQIDEALRIIRDEALNGAPIPEALVKFYVPDEPLVRQIERNIGRRNRTFYTREGLSEEAAERLQVEAEGLRETNASRVLGFVAHPCASALAHWDLTLLGESIDPSSPLGMQLVEWTLNHGHQAAAPALGGSGNNNMVRPADVQIEMLMPFDFPVRGPTFRVIAPRFKDVHKLNMSLSQSQSAMNEDEMLTVSRDLDSNWDPSSSVADMVARVRERLEGAEVDLEAGKDGSLATVGGFWRSYLCMSPAAIGRPEQEHSGQITLPSSALEQLFNQPNNYGLGRYGRRQLMDSGGLHQSGGPMTFEISTNGGKRSFCGVAEFTAEENTCVMPDWMAKNLQLKLGEEVHVRRVYVPKGIYMKLQPHDARYAKVGDTKRMLEWVLQRYTAVSAGDTLVVNYRGQDFAFNILEVSPGKAIRLIDSDVAVDFAPPLSGEEVPKMLEPVEEKETAGSATSSAAAAAAAAAPTASGAPATSAGTAVGGVEVSGTENVDWKRCPTCRRGIPMASFDRHSIPCSRLNWFCELCQVAVEKRSQQEHLTACHTLFFCDCGTELETRFLAAHKQNDCVLRDRNCSFCQLRMPHVELKAHESHCGSKTEKCDACGLFVKIRDMPGHHNVCGIEDKNVPPRRDDDWGGLGGGGGGRNRGNEDNLFTCPTCNEPFEQFDDYEVHMLVAHPELLPQEQPEKQPEKIEPFVFQPPDL